MTGGEIVVVLLAAATAAVVKSALGTGYPLILIPALALFMDVADAVVIVAPSNLALNLWLGWQVRTHRADSPTLGRFVAASLVGAALGALMVPIAPDRALRLFLVAVIVLFVVTRFRGHGLVLDERSTARWTPIVGGAAGISQGAAGISGPIVTPWFLSLGLGRDAFIYSITVVFALAGLAQLVVLAAQGLFTDDLLIVSVLLIPLALLLLPVGVRLRSRLPLAVFEQLVIVVLVGSAVSLAVRSF